MTGKEKKAAPSTIVLAEDDSDMRDILSFWLEGEGYKVYPVSNGWEAIRRTLALLEDGGSVQAVILDLLMPGVDGYQACRYIRHDSRLYTIPVVLFSAIFVDEEEQRFGFDVGADDFVMKTSGFNALLRSVDRVIREKARVSRNLIDESQARLVREEIEAIVRVG